MPKTVFELIKDVSGKKVPIHEQSESDLKQFTPYMVNRIFSMDPNYVDFVNELQQATNQLGVEATYQIYYDFIPKKNFFAKYLTSKKDRVNVPDDVIKFFKERYQLGRHEIDEWLARLLPAHKELLKQELLNYGIEVRIS